MVWNRAQTVSDGVWRTLDGKALHPFVVALSERHVGLVEDLMTQRFGVAWAETRAIAGRVAKRDVDGVAPDLVAEFSRRTLAIEAVIAQKAAELQAARGRAPTSDELGVIHRAAWRETGFKKAHRSVAEMTAEWCERARPWVGDEPASWVAGLAGRSDLPARRADDLTGANAPRPQGSARDEASPEAIRRQVGIVTPGASNAAVPRSTSDPAAPTPPLKTPAPAPALSLADAKPRAAEPSTTAPTPVAAAATAARMPMICTVPRQCWPSVACHASARPLPRAGLRVGQRLCPP